MSIKCFFGFHDFKIIDVMNGIANGKKHAQITLITYKCKRCQKVEQKVIDGHVIRSQLES